MQRSLFLPTARQLNLLLIVAFLAFGEALYLRYMAIENGNLAQACQTGVDTWLCMARRLSLTFFTHEAFGAVALVAALLNLIRPSLILLAFALAVAGFGLVLHNVDLAGLAVAVLILSLARPAPAPM